MVVQLFLGYHPVGLELWTNFVDRQLKIVMAGSGMRLCLDIVSKLSTYCMYIEGYVHISVGN